MTDQLVKDEVSAGVLEQVMIGGDLSKLSAAQRVEYYGALCKSLDLNPLSRPFEYITLNNKLVLYARRDCTEQLRYKRGVSIEIVSREIVADCYVVGARAILPDGRTDESIGAVNVKGLFGEAYANALMKAETKAKRRVTLSVCGLGLVDESEVDTIPGALRSPPSARGARVEAERENKAGVLTLAQEMEVAVEGGGASVESSPVSAIGVPLTPPAAEAAARSGGTVGTDDPWDDLSALAVRFVGAMKTPLLMSGKDPASGEALPGRQYLVHADVLKAAGYARPTLVWHDGAFVIAPSKVAAIAVEAERTIDAATQRGK